MKFVYIALLALFSSSDIFVSCSTKVTTTKPKTQTTTSTIGTGGLKYTALPIKTTTPVASATIQA